MSISGEINKWLKGAVSIEADTPVEKAVEAQSSSFVKFREGAVLKGDLPGHEFHGNQYADNPHSPGETAFARRMGASWSALMESANARDAAQNGRTGAQTAYAHKGAAFEHRIAAQVLTNALEKTTDPEKRGLIKAAIEAHTDAAHLHDFAGGQHASGTDSAYARDNSLLAHGASNVASTITHLTGEDRGAEFGK